MRRAWRRRPSLAEVLWVLLAVCAGAWSLTGCGSAEAQDPAPPSTLDPATAAYLQALSQQSSVPATTDVLNWVVGLLGGGGGLYVVRNLIRDLVGDLVKGGIQVTVTFSAEDRRLMADALDGQRERGKREAEIENLTEEVEKLRLKSHDQNVAQQRTDMRVGALEGTGWGASTPLPGPPRKAPT